MGLYSLGPFFPATAETVSEAPWSDNAWVNPGSLSATNANGAYIVDPTYDNQDQSYVLKAYNFSGFSAIPAGATILGVQSNLTANYFTAAGAAPRIDLAQLLTNQRVKGGTNQYAGAEETLTTATNANYSKGGPFDLWGNALSAAWLQHSGFGIAFGVSAKSNNTDISADAVRLTVWYSVPDAYTLSNEGGVIVIHGGVSTGYFATQPDADVPWGVFDSPADYSASLITEGTAYPYVGVVEAAGEAESYKFREKDYQSSIHAEAEASAVQFKEKQYAGAVESTAEAVSSGFRAKYYESAVNAVVSEGIDLSVAFVVPVESIGDVVAESVRYIDRIPLADAAWTVDVGADVTADITAPQEYAYVGAVESVLVADDVLLLSYAPGADLRSIVYAESALEVSRVPVADAEFSVLAESSISASITTAGNIETGTAAWSLSGGVSTVYFATQLGAGVPIHNIEAASEWLFGTPQQTIVVAGAVAAAFTVGDGTISTFVLIQPVLEGSVAEQFYCASVLDIYSTPVYTNYLIDGTAAWRMAEPASEYWVGISGDRAFPLHDFAAAADYVSSSSTYHVFNGLADAVFTAEATQQRAKIPLAAVAGTAVAAAVYAGGLNQQIVETGTAAAVFTSAGERVQTVVTEGTSTAVFAASSVEVAPYPGRTIYVDGDAACVFTQAGAYSTSVPTAVAVVGDVAFFADALAEKAVANLYDALTEYEAFAAGKDVFDPWVSSDEYEQEPLPGGTFTVEAHPTDGYTLEPVPPMYAGQDGFFAEPGQDGFYDEYPSQGFYADIGYRKEFKPFHRATYTQEIAPSTPYTLALADGAYTAGGMVLAGGVVSGRTKEGKPT